MNNGLSGQNALINDLSCLSEEDKLSQNEQFKVTFMSEKTIFATLAIQIKLAQHNFLAQTNPKALTPKMLDNKHQSMSVHRHSTEVIPTVLTSI